LNRTVRNINIVLLTGLVIIACFSAGVVKRYYRLDVLRGEFGILLKQCLHYELKEYSYAFWDLFKDYEAEYELIIDDAKYEKLIGNLPWSGQKYKKCELVVPGKTLTGKVKLHGDGYYHYAFAKKSFKVKLDTPYLHNGNNSYHFIFPKGNELLNNLMSYRLAKCLGVMTPDVKLTTLKVNGTYRGIKLMVEDINKNYLSHHGMPLGDIYSGENSGFKDIFFGAWKVLVEGEYLWSKKSFNNHYDRENSKPLSIFLKEVYSSDYHTADLEQFANFSVAINLMNTYHFDTQHNWRLYYDPAKEKMRPIMWDPVGHKLTCIMNFCL